MELDAVTNSVLNAIDTNGFRQEGAYNLRYNGQALCHGDSEHIKIRRKEDKQGIDVYISSEAKGEQVHIPVVISKSGMMDIVYNDFYIEEGADVVIVAGCGIHNSGCNETRHDGIHAFHVGKNAKVVYEEKHYGEGEGTGENILNPVTQIYLEEGAMFTLDTVQIRGVDSTERKTDVDMGPGSRLVVMEKPVGGFQYGGKNEWRRQFRPDRIPFRGKGNFAPDLSSECGGECPVQSSYPMRFYYYGRSPGMLHTGDRCKKCGRPDRS